MPVWIPEEFKVAKGYDNMAMPFGFKGTTARHVAQVTQE